MELLLQAGILVLFFLLLVILSYLKEKVSNLLGE
jgi:hypothetical protein